MRKSFVALGLLAITVFAGSTSQNTNLTGSIESGCSVDNTPSLAMSFSGFEDSTGSFDLQMTCSNSLAYTIDIDAGQNANANIRRATDGNGNYLAYRLYQDSAMSQEIGVSANNQISGTGTGNQETYTFYAKVATADNDPLPPTGTYQDTLAITISW